MKKTPQQSPFPYVLVSDQDSGGPGDPPTRNLHRPEGSLFLPIPEKDEALRAWHFRDSFEDEVSEPGYARLSNHDGVFFVAIPKNEAMAPLHPIGSFVIFQDAAERDPVNGDIVYVSLASRPTARRDEAGRQYSVCIRQYVVSKKGRVSLKPFDKSFTTWTAGVRKGVETRMRILGVATGHKPRGFYVSLVQS